MRLVMIVLASALPLALLAPPEPVQAQGLMVTGYADFEATITNPDGDGNSDFYFDNHHANLILVGSIFEDLFAAAEVEYEHAGDEIALEYAYFAYTGIPNLRIMAGKFIVPFGRFNKDLHPTFINKMPDTPLGFRHIMPGTYNDVGVWVSGAQPISEGSGARVVYDGFVVNGLLGEDGGDIRSFRGNIDESRTGTSDDNKAVGGRLGFELGPQGLEFGGSVYHGNYSDDEALGTLNLTLWGADAAFRREGFEVRGEYVRAEQEETGGDLVKQGGYGQVSYLVVPQFEPVVRYSLRDMPLEDQDQRRLSFGVNFHISAASIFRLAYHFNMEETGFESDNNAIVSQWNIIF